MNKLLKSLLMGLYFRNMVVPEDSDEAVGTGGDARLALLSRINDQNEQGMVEDFRDIGENDQLEPFTPAKLEGETETEDDEPVEPEETEEQEPETPAEPQLYTLKVNGKELKVTMDELLARAQKVEAADTYLSEAARLKREAEQQIKQPVLPDEGEQSASLEHRRRALVRAIQTGTEDEAMEALDELQNMNRGPSFTKDDLARTVDERLTFQQAVSRFQTDYQDVWGDPVLQQMVIQRDAVLVQQGDSRSYYERYQAIGEDIRAWKNSLLKESQKQTTGNDKLTRKVSAPRVVTSNGSKVRTEVAEDDREESPSEVIAAIAKSRGGPQWSRA